MPLHFLFTFAESAEKRLNYREEGKNVLAVACGGGAENQQQQRTHVRTLGAPYPRQTVNGWKLGLYTSSPLFRNLRAGFDELAPVDRMESAGCEGRNCGNYFAAAATADRKTKHIVRFFPPSPLKTGGRKSSLEK